MDRLTNGKNLALRKIWLDVEQILKVKEEPIILLVKGGTQFWIAFYVFLMKNKSNTDKK